ncbi:unnamed protein product [Caenorhabditis angaria]|uniref:Arrestin C-terminal-like domain-containing protein n=1 Tax=Caenorhabditis angaria TaxID=860376 RepID=A0A9P1N2Y4_9PELO|nr:unnamed protein product [Caenorhabditis angaria]
MLILIIGILAIANAEIIPRELLFEDPKYSSVSLSPDGRQVAYIAPDDNGIKNVFVRCSSCSSTKQVTFEGKHAVLGYSWTALPDIILYSQDDHGDENTRLYKKNISENADKNNRYTVSDKAHVKAIIMANNVISENVLIGLNDENPALHNIYSFNLRTNELIMVLRNKRFPMFIFDTDMNIRLASEEGPDGQMIYYKPLSRAKPMNTEKDNWVEYMRVDHDDKPITMPISFDKTNNFMYWILGENSDLGNLVVLPFETPNQRETLYTAQKAQIGNVLIHPIDKTLIAVTEVYHKPELFVANETYMDDLQYLVNLKPSGSMQILSMSNDMNTWLITYASADHPFEIYIYRKWVKKAELFMSTRPELKNYQLNKQVGFDFPTRDDFTLQAYLSLPPTAPLLKSSQVPDADKVYANMGMIPAVPQKLVVLVHGGPKARDSYGFSPTNAWLTNRGYAVLQVNFRGSVGFGKRLTNAGNGEWGRKMHFDILDAVEFAIAKGIANRNEIAIMGGSYGGYETLVALTFTPNVFACGVDIVGPSNLISLMQAVPPYWLGFYKDLVKMLGADITSEEGRESLTARSPLFFADKVSKPLMILQGANDPRVRQHESDQFVAALEKKNIPVTYILYPDEGHGFRKANNRLEQHGHIESFLHSCLGGKTQPFQPGQYKSSAIVKSVGIEEIPVTTTTVSTTENPTTTQEITTTRSSGTLAPTIFYRPAIRANRVHYPPSQNVMNRIFPVQDSPRRHSVGHFLRQFASTIIPLAQVPVKKIMPTTQINIVLSESRTMAGEYFNAKILLDSSDPDTIIHSFTAEIKGIGRTGWVNIHTDKIFETEKSYIDTQIQLCEPGTCLPVGKHQFPIQIQIPANAPSSYESQFGSVRYQMKVDLSASTEQASSSEVFPLVVLNRSFFDEVPLNVMSPIDFKDEVDFTCCTLPFGCVSLVMSLPRTAYRIGESIECIVTINNRTRKGLKEVALQLVMKTQFEARSRYEHVNEKKLAEQLIEMVSLGAVRSRCRMEFEKCYLKIPDAAPPTQNYNRGGGESSIIAIHYVLKLTALPGIECEVPLVVTSCGYMDSHKQDAFQHHLDRARAKTSKCEQRKTRSIVEENPYFR